MLVLKTLRAVSACCWGSPSWLWSRQTEHLSCCSLPAAHGEGQTCQLMWSLQVYHCQRALFLRQLRSDLKDKQELS